MLHISFFHRSKTRAAAALLVFLAAEAVIVWSVRSTSFHAGIFIVQTLLALGAGLLVLADFEPHRYAQIIFLILAPVLAFYGLETFTHNPFQMELSPQFMNLLLFWFFYLLLFVLLGNLKRTVITGSILFALIGTANHYVMEFRDNPILPWDLRSFSTAMSVTDNFVFTVPAAMIFTLLLFLYLCILGSKCTLKAPALKHRAWMAALAVCLLLAMKTALYSTAVTDRVLTFSNLFTQWATYRDNGFVVSFIQNTKYLNIDEPEQYSEKQIKEEADAQRQEDDDTPVSAADSPNIIVIMNEAFSDLSVLHDFAASEDCMPFVHSLQTGGENTVTGNLFVSVVGGNTANTEFEFLSGSSLAFLPSGSVPYQQYISDPMPTLATSLKDCGYRTIAMHPYLPGGWNRDRVYPLLGFDETYFRSDFEQPQIIRKYISDRSDYQKIRELYETKQPEDKLFVFNVTMQNHSSYSQIYDNFPPTVHLQDLAREYPATENYLTLIKESDAAFQELTEYFAQEEEDTIILLFGDHQPNDYVTECIASLTGVPKAERGLEEQQNRFIVPFILWANFDIEEQHDVRLSVNYLGTLLLETAGLPMPQWQQYLSRLSKTLPVVTANVCIDHDGTYYPVRQDAHPYQELLDQYWRFQYNLMFDPKHHPEQFFTPDHSS